MAISAICCLARGNAEACISAIMGCTGIVIVSEDIYGLVVAIDAGGIHRDTRIRCVIINPRSALNYSVYVTILAFIGGYGKTSGEHV